jgi:hypothetical protein
MSHHAVLNRLFRRGQASLATMLLCATAPAFALTANAQWSPTLNTGNWDVAGNWTPC